MNRIILIGNGFDLAHGLKTSYKDFYDDYWKRLSAAIVKKRYHRYSDNNVSIEILEGKSFCECWRPLNPINSYSDFKDHMYEIQVVI